MNNFDNVYIGRKSVVTTWHLENKGNAHVDGQFIVQSALLKSGSVTSGIGILWYRFGMLEIEAGADIGPELELRPYGGGTDFRAICQSMENSSQIGKSGSRRDVGCHGVSSQSQINGGYLK